MQNSFPEGKVPSSLFYLNGIDVETGTYLLAPIPIHEVAALALAERVARDHLEELERWREELERR